MNKINWIERDDYVIGEFKKKLDSLNNSSIGAACFDLDWTLIKPTKGRFSKTDIDWELIDKNILDKLKKYIGSKHFIIISNQKNLKSKLEKYKFWKSKVNKFANLINIPFIIFVSIKNDLYRKPMIGLWEKFIKCDKSKSFYCGDAGGLGLREINGITIKDFSDSDLKFAVNIGIKFIHRDEFIFDVIPKELKIYYPIDFKKLEKSKDLIVDFDFRKKELLINVGCPASGKSFFTKNFIEPLGYKYVNQDTFGTLNKCLKACIDAIENGNSVVIDNTNPSKAIRQKYLDLAIEYGYKARCLYFTTPLELAKHNNCYRNYITNGNSKKIPEIAYRVYKKKFVNPIIDEGFDDVIKIDFILSINKINKSKYEMFYY